MSTLLSNKTNLLPSLISFIEKSESLTIYSAFIKNDLLKEIVKHADGRIQQIIVRWQSDDLIKGISDLDVYKTCRQNNITLYRNTSLHAKCIVNEKGDCILGSSNYTNKGMLKSEASNWEINTKVQQIDFDSRVLLQRILLESNLVTEEWVKEVEELIKDYDKNEETIELPSAENIDFLISSLPMCSHPEVLWEIIYQDKVVPFEELSSASHDLALYQLVEAYNTKEDFLEELKLNFNSHPFISKLIHYIKENNSCRYGQIVNWIKDNCTEVPAPRSWQLKEKQIVNILYEWICYLNDDLNYVRKYPNGSDIIEYSNHIL